MTNPFAARFAGVVVVPMNTVASAKAGVATATSSAAASRESDESHTE